MAKKLISCMGSQLNKIVDQTKHVNYINELISQLLPKHLSDHCRVSGFAAGVMLLEIDSPTLASEMRFHLPQLRNELRIQHKLYHLSAIKLINSSSVANNNKQRVKKSVASSKHAAETLRNQSAGMDDELAKAINKLASSIESR